MTRHIAILSPCGSGMMPARVTGAWLALDAALRAAGWAPAWLVLSGVSTGAAWARNACLAHYRVEQARRAEDAPETCFDGALWLDADQTFDAAAVVRMVEYAARNSKVVGAAAKFKDGSGTWAVSFEAREPRGLRRSYPLRPDHAGIRPVDVIGYGCMYWPKAAVEAILAGVVRYRTDDPAPHDDHPRVFGVALVAGRVVGEDVAALHRLRSLGWQTYCDTRVRTGHIGLAEYGGCLADELGGA